MLNLYTDKLPKIMRAVNKVSIPVFFQLSLTSKIKQTLQQFSMIFKPIETGYKNIRLYMYYNAAN